MGQKFAAFDAQGNITAFYDDQDSPVPADVTNVLKITDAQWQTCLSVPGYMVQAGALVAPTPPTAAQLLAQAQSTQIATLGTAYNTAIQQPVSYISKGGVTKTYQVNQQSIANLSQMLLAFQASATVPNGFYWIAADNAQVPFTYADMQGLAQAMGVQGAAAFQRLQTLKAAVNAATTLTAVQAIAWT